MVEVPDYNFLSADTVKPVTQTIGNWLDISKKTYDVRQQQANEAVGNILQQSTDAQGNVDYPAAQRRAAAAGPIVQTGMQTFLANNSARRSEQINNAAGTARLIGIHSANVMLNGSDANVDAAFDDLRAHGMPADQVEAERARWKAMSPEQRQQEAYRVNLGNLEQMHQVIGQTTLTDFGGYKAPYTTQQPAPSRPGGGYQEQGGVTTTLGPESTYGAQVTFEADQDYVKKHPGTTIGQKITRPMADIIREQGGSAVLPPGARFSGAPSGGGGVVNSDGSSVSVKQPRLLVVPGSGGQGGSTTAPPASPAPAAVPAPPWAPPGGSTAPYTGGGVGSVLGGGGGRPALQVPPVPPPAPRSDLGGGVSVASANALAPNLGPSAPPSPAVAGDVSAIMAGMNRARATPAAGPQVAGDVALGAGYDEKTNATASAERLAADDKVSASYAQNVFPYAQALSKYGRGMVTAPTSDFANTMKGYAGGLFRSLTGYSGLFDSTKEYDELHKWLAQITTSNPFAAGSDARLAETLAGNANTGIHELAGADMMKAGLALQRMNATANSEWHNMSPADRAKVGYYNDFLRNYSKTVDPRAFAVDMLNPEQKKTLQADLKSHDDAYRQRFLDSYNMAKRNGYLGETRAMF